jgi:hypothetical protein
MVYISTGAGDLSLLQSQTDSGAHTASHFMDTGVSFPGVKPRGYISEIKHRQNVNLSNKLITKKNQTTTAEPSPRKKEGAND